MVPLAPWTARTVGTPENAGLNLTVYHPGFESTKLPTCIAGKVPPSCGTTCLILSSMHDAHSSRLKNKCSLSAIEYDHTVNEMFAGSLMSTPEKG